MPIDSLKRNAGKGFIKNRLQGQISFQLVTEFVTEQVDMNWYEIDLRKKKNLVKSAFYEVLSYFVSLPVNWLGLEPRAHTLKVYCSTS